MSHVLQEEPAAHTCRFVVTGDENFKVSTEAVKAGALWDFACHQELVLRQCPEVAPRLPFRLDGGSQPRTEASRTTALA